MQIPLQIVFRGIPHSDAVEANIRKKADKLDKFCSHIMSCRVAVEAEHQHHHHGNLYHIRIDITTPQKELVVSREHHDKHAHEDVYVAIRDAFNAAERQIKDYSSIIRGDVKTHNHQDLGMIVRLVPEEDHGFIQAPDGHELYFHRNSVNGNHFDELEVGSTVRFIEEESAPGPQASAVYP